MSDRFQPITMEALCEWVFGEWKARRSIFGIPEELFFRPSSSDPFRTRVYGQVLETPFGVAAGPHSQMAQNIIAAWLCGARFIELKTVQTLDELEVSKPCIDMQDAGFNVEWSQELKICQSFTEYVRAWVLIHILHRLLGFPGETPGVVFNMSVGYDMKGILAPNVQEFLRLMADAQAGIRECVRVVRRFCPAAGSVDIPARLSDNVTLSTMHGCPPSEIGTISRYLLTEHRLHTSVKLNPTLLGPHQLREILNGKLGYHDIIVPDDAFMHDLKYDAAVDLLRELTLTAARSERQFGVKLSNTLEVVNNRSVFSGREKMMYMSGRPLHALTVTLASVLDSEFSGLLPMSFAGGADAHNAPDLLACGMQTVTSCSDLLRAGGYTRLLQYIANTRRRMHELEAENLNQFACLTARRTFGFNKSKCASETAHRACPRLNLKSYENSVVRDAAYSAGAFERRRTKTARPLGAFDCIKAPCVDECPIDQKVPEYMALVRDGRWREAAALTRQDNPLPSILGRACNHLCEQVCMRTHYDEPLAIRDIKRAIMDHETDPAFPLKAEARREKIAIIGAGPCGLSTAYFLLLAGYGIEIFEARSYAGGMVSGTIPGYRAAMEKVKYDMDLVLSLGARVHYGRAMGRDLSLAMLREDGFAATVLAVGAQRVGKLGIEGEEGEGVYDALTFLRASREGTPMPLGSRVAVIGGGDVAMDCARTAVRLGASDTRILYRRTRAEMPAGRDELRELAEEQIPVVELTAPKAVERRDGQVAGLRCIRMTLGQPDASGRRRPVEVPGSEFDIPFDQVIVAVNQRPDLSFFDGEAPALTDSGYLKVDDDMQTSLENVYAGGDIGPDGPSSIVRALGDGRRIALSIRRRFEKNGKGHAAPGHGIHLLERAELVDLLDRRSRRPLREHAPETPLDQRNRFDEVVRTMSDESAMREASRCLDCQKLCSYCVGVCPNMALFTWVNNFNGTWLMPVLRWSENKWSETETETVTIGQRYQVAVLTDVCNECGNCVMFCPASGKPYRDKPRFYVSLGEFEAERDNAYRIMREGDRWSLESRRGGVTVRLTLEDDRVVYEHPCFTARLHAATLDLEGLTEHRSCDLEEVSLAPAAEMWVMLSAIRDDRAYMPMAVKV